MSLSLMEKLIFKESAEAKNRKNRTNIGKEKKKIKDKKKGKQKEIPWAGSRKSCQRKKVQIFWRLIFDDGSSVTHIHESVARLESGEIGAMYD